MADVFKDKSEMPKEFGTAAADGSPMMTFSDVRRESFPAGCSVAVDMTCDQRRNLTMSNYPRYDALDTHHVARPRFGHGY